MKRPDRPTRAIKLLGDRYTIGVESGSDIYDYITQLEAELEKAREDVKRLDKLRGWLKEKTLPSSFGTGFQEGYKRACHEARKKLEEPHE